MDMADHVTAGQKPANVFPAELREALGSLCEVRKKDNKLLFLGRVLSFDGPAVSVYPIGGKEAPPVIYNDEFKLVIRPTGAPALAWHGQICGSSRAFWKLDHLVCFHMEEQRAAFRQPVSARANVLCVNALYPGARRGEKENYAHLAKVVDISLGGLQLHSQDHFEVGDHLLVMNLQLDSALSQPFSFTVKVCWAVPAGRMETRYGCAFEQMNDWVEDRLCGAIFDLQRNDIASR